MTIQKYLLILERSATARNIRIRSVYFSQTSEDSPLPALLPSTACVAPEQQLDFVIFGHVNRSCYCYCYTVTGVTDTKYTSN